MSADCLAAASAEIRVGRSGQAGLALGYRLDDELGFFDKFIQCSADDRITLGVKDYPAFQVPAGLNFGDCLSYALAIDRREPLLWKGNDFGHTGVQRALDRR